jgi:hypothetical protein
MPAPVARVLFEPELLQTGETSQFRVRSEIRPIQCSVRCSSKRRCLTDSPESRSSMSE